MCMDCGHESWLEVIEDILDCGNVPRSTENFLEDVASWIEDNEHVTEKQIAKIKEIADEFGISYRAAEEA